MVNQDMSSDIIQPGRERGLVIMDEKRTMPLLEHLEELRKRLIICVIAIGAHFSVAYIFREKLFRILARPLVEAMPPGEKMIFMGVPEAFFCYLKVALFSAIVMAVPIIMYEMWRFVAPGLYGYERRFLFFLVLLSCLFFACGVLFGYFVVFPFAFKYLLNFGSNLVRPLPSMGQYLGLATALLLAFGFSFQLPLVLTLLAHVGLITPDFLKKKRKYAILLVFVAAAILTPTPDAFNQLLMAGPLLVLYEMGIWGARVFGKKSRAKMPIGPVHHPSG